jgi:AraC family transcriptional regulator
VLLSCYKLYDAWGIRLLAKIAVDVERALARRVQHGGPGRPEARILARGDGWIVEDMVCTSGPHDRPYEEQHSEVAIAIVTSGSFQYRASGSRTGRELMTPGSLLLGHPGQHFECGHEHGAGDRCLSFRYAPDYFEALTADAASGARPRFRSLRLPPLRALSPVVARACAALAGSSDVTWEEMSVQLAVQTARVDGDLARVQNGVTPAAVARVTRTVRMVERRPDARLTLGTLAREAGLSPFHFLRTFESLTGVTPHQYLMRARLRHAAARLVVEPGNVLDIALDSGFGDVSNFNRAFRGEFGVSPRAYRREKRLSGSTRS